MNYIINYKKQLIQCSIICINKGITMKKKIRRSIYLFDTEIIKLKKGTNFQKLFHKWYMSGSNIVPCRVYDYLEREGILNNDQ